MAKKSAIAKNERRRLRAERTQERRAELVAQLKNPETDDEERDAIYLRLRKMGRDASPVRYRLRCGITGRSRSNYRKFGICRNKFRDLALLGEIPGVRKASW
ncbi:MAG: 30S ribosomal protein S14 [Planctomycetota bacterium]|jgi:small subunit ribosomal protein S14